MQYLHVKFYFICNLFMSITSCIGTFSILSYILVLKSIPTHFILLFIIFCLYYIFYKKYSTQFVDLISWHSKLCNQIFRKNDFTYFAWQTFEFHLLRKFRTTFLHFTRSYSQSYPLFHIKKGSITLILIPEIL